MTAGLTLLGLGSLLLTVSEEQALQTEVRRLPPEDTEVAAYLVQVANGDAIGVRRDAQRVVERTLAPFDSRTSSGAVSVMRRLGSDRLAYLASSDDLAERARLLSGRWPTSSSRGDDLEAAVPETAARRLGLSLGSRISLGREIDEQFVERPVTILVVGTFRSRSRAGWQQDPLSGVGFDPSYSNGAVQAPAYGPFEVDAGALLASGSSFASLGVTARPRLDTVTGQALETVASSLRGADPRLSAAVGNRVKIERVASELPRTLERVRAQQAASRATVVVTVLLGTALAAAALLLAGRSLSQERREQQELVVTMGAGRRQLLALALGEGALLAACAVALAVPVSALLHAWLTHLPMMTRAGLDRPPGFPATLLPAVVLGSVVLTAALVMPALRGPRERSAAEAPRGARAARSGIGVLLSGLVGVSWWQLHSQPAATATSGDVVQIAAPVVWVMATAVIAVRLLPALFHLVSRSVGRSRGLLLPLAVVETARRPPSATASVLVVAGVASATFGLCLGATWDQSQHDQAALRVGTDLSVALTTPPTIGEAEAVSAATGGVVSAVTARPVALGRYVGEAGTAPTLVATDARRAEDLWRGRAPAGSSWNRIGQMIAAPNRVIGVPLRSDRLVITGSLSQGGGAAVRVSPTLVVQGDQGLRTPVSTHSVTLDGREHVVRLQLPASARQQVVALQLEFSTSPTAEVPAAGVARDLELTLRLPGGASDREVAWASASLGQSPTPVTAPQERVASGGRTTSLVTRAKLSLDALPYAGARVVATAFEAPAAVPVAVSSQLEESVGVKVGGTFEVNVEGVAVAARVEAIVPTVPSAPGRIAVLADQDMLSRTLLAAGRLEPITDTWWVGRPRSDAAAKVRALGVGDVVVRREVAQHLSAGPLAVMVPSALVILVLAALSLAVAGTGLRLSSELRSRATEIARLRAAGLSRRMVTRLLIGQQGAIVITLVLLGATLGAGASAALVRLLVRSDAGLAPVPAVELVWPWPGELLVVAGVGLACLVSLAAVVAVHVRRSDDAMSRLGGS